jgi:hypothetical protein
LGLVSSVWLVLSRFLFLSRQADPKDKKEPKKAKMEQRIKDQLERQAQCLRDLAAAEKAKEEDEKEAMVAKAEQKEKEQKEKDEETARSTASVSSSASSSTEENASASASTSANTKENTRANTKEKTTEKKNIVVFVVDCYVFKLPEVKFTEHAESLRQMTVVNKQDDDWTAYNKFRQMRDHVTVLLKMSSPGDYRSSPYFFKQYYAAAGLVLEKDEVAQQIFVVY